MLEVTDEYSFLNYVRRHFKGRELQEVLDQNMPWSHRTRKDYLLLYLISFCSHGLILSILWKTRLFYGGNQWCMHYLACNSAGESLSSFLSLVKQLKREESHITLNLQITRIILHTAYSLVLGIFHIVWVIELILRSFVWIVDYFYMPFSDI